MTKARDCRVVGAHSTRMRCVLLVAISILSVVAQAAEEPATRFTGRHVAAVIDEFRAAGYPLAYSTNLVTDDMLVTIEPRSNDPPDIIRQILAPYGLTLRVVADVYLVVRVSQNKPAAPSAVGNPVKLAEPLIEKITVYASRYEISRDIATSKTVIDQKSIQKMPDIGEDPLRITQRLPGTAASGVSARTHFRGGEQDEVGIMLNGLWLFDPFHVRNYQNIFSTVDSRAIEGVEVYTGGFPVRYGDRMSGLVVMETLQPDEPRRSEIGFSTFDTSLLTAGSSDRLSWLFSARRGNLDLFVDKRYGKPVYYDVFGEVAFDFAEDSRLSINTLYADDQIELVLEPDAEDRQQSDSKTRNAQVWIQLDNRWSDYLSSKTVLSAVSYRDYRNVSLNDPQSIVASVLDNRAVEQRGLRQEWTWTPSEKHRVQWGFQALYNDATFDYAGDAEYFELAASFQGMPDTLSRRFSVSRNGGSYGAFISDRWKLTPRTVAEWGLRWDDQTYTGLSSDSQLSPRINLLFQARPRTELRFSWGRYYQSQQIQDLQIEDGIANFWPAQHADHLILGLRQLLGGDYALRVEFFQKNISGVRPRFENLFNPLNLVPELQPDRVRLDPTSATAAGFELSIDHSAGMWDWWASYTLSKTTDRIDGRNVSRNWDQRHAFQGGIGWSSEAWSFNAAVSAHSGWPRSDLVLLPGGTDEAGEILNIAVPSRNRLRYDTFVSVDVRLSRRFRLSRGSLLAFVEVSNTLDRRNPCCLDWDLTEDSAGNAILENDVRNWLPLIPAAGILWEF
jgi:outer membrane receptor protein involved in Fe transport